MSYTGIHLFTYKKIITIVTVGEHYNIFLKIKAYKEAKKIIVLNSIFETSACAPVFL